MCRSSTLGECPRPLVETYHSGRIESETALPSAQIANDVRNVGTTADCKVSCPFLRAPALILPFPRVFCYRAAALLSTVSRGARVSERSELRPNRSAPKASRRG